MNPIIILVVLLVHKFNGLFSTGWLSGEEETVHGWQGSPSINGPKNNKTDRARAPLLSLPLIIVQRTWVYR